MKTADYASGEQRARLQALQRRRRKIRIFIPLGLIVLAIVGLLAMSMLRQPPEKRAVDNPPPLVDVITVAPETTRLTVRSQGTVVPRVRSGLVPEVTGRIQAVSENYVAGGFFRKGELILEIDPSDYEVALKRAQATLAANRARLAEEEARAEQARKDWEKLDSRRGSSPPELVLRKPQLAEARAALRLAEADVQKARKDLERTRIKAPYDALVANKSADLGQYVTAGTRLAELVAVDYAELRLPVASRELDYLGVQGGILPEGRRLPVTLQASQGGDGPVWQAEIVRSEGMIDEATRVHYLVARIDDPYQLKSELDAPPLPMGQFVRAEIQGRRLEDAVILPRHLLRRDETVLVAGSDGTLDIVPVDLLRSDTEHAYITGGLAAGDRVITTAIEFPAEGMALRIEGDDAEPEDAAPTDAEPDEAVAVAPETGEGN